MFHGDPQHTGQSPYPGPTIPVLAWRFQAGSSFYASPVVGNGRIYAIDADGILYALNPEGHLLWTFHTGHRTDEPLHASSPAIGSDGTIYVASCVHCDGFNHNVPPEGVLYALNPAGRLKWTLTIPNSGEGIDILTSPTIGADGIIYVSDVGFRIIAVNPDGSLKWQVHTNGEVVGPPAVASNGTVYVSVDDPGPPVGACQFFNKCLLALNPDGSVRWSRLIFTGFDSPAVGPDGTVYVDGYSIDSNGTVLWKNGLFRSPSIGADGTIYGITAFPSSGLNAVQPNGSVKWIFPLAANSGSSVLAPSLVISSNGFIFFGVSFNSGIEALLAVNLNGSMAWVFEIGVQGASSILTDPAIGSGGTVYIGSSDGNLYAIN